MAEDLDAKERNRRRAGADPTRIRMLELFDLKTEWTAKEMAQELRMLSNRLYYHLRLLEELGAIKVVGTKAPGRMVERVYAATDFFPVTWDPNNPGENAMQLAALLDASKAEAEDALYEQARLIDSGEEPLFLTYARPSMSGMHRSDIEEFSQRLLALDREFRERGNDRMDADGNPPSESKVLKYVYVIYEEPLPGWLGQTKDPVGS